MTLCQSFYISFDSPLMRFDEKSQNTFSYTQVKCQDIMKNCKEGVYKKKNPKYLFDADRIISLSG